MVVALVVMVVTVDMEEVAEEDTDMATRVVVMAVVVEVAITITTMAMETLAVVSSLM